MNSGKMTALRRLGLALVIGTITAGGALAAADGSGSAGGADEAAAAPGAPAAGAPDLGAQAGRNPGQGYGAHRGHEWHHDGAMGRWRGFDRGRGMMMDRGFFAALRQLHLTPVQREQMRTIVFNAREAGRMERANREQSGDAQRQRQDFAALSNPGDPNYARAVQQLKSRAAERVQQAITRATDTEQKIYNLLTAEQKAQLPKVLSDLKARHEQRMQAMRMRRDGSDGASGPGSEAPLPPPLPQ